MTRREAKDKQLELFPNLRSPTQPGDTLPEICLAVRASVSGAADPWPASALRETRAMLGAIVTTWETGKDDAIDKQIRAMCFAAIDIINAELSDRQNRNWDF